MKAFKAIAAMAMAMALAGVLAACGSSSSSSAASSAASESASAASESASASSAAAESSFERGTVQGDTYTSELFGVTWTLPSSDYSFYDDEQLASLNTAISDLLSDEAITEALESGNAFFDMAAASSETGANINVVVEYAGTPEAKAIDATGYSEAVQDAVKKQLESMGGTVASIESTTYTSASGAEFPSLVIALEMNDMQVCEQQVYLKADDYFMSITATGADKATAESILSTLALI